jgi:hypothetical protein
LAIQPKDNEAFYREVDEELRRDQLSGVWQRHGKLIILGVVLFLAAIGGALWWQQHREGQKAEQGASLIAAFEDVQASKPREAAEKLDRLVQEGSDGYRAAALLTKADLAAESGKAAEAIAGYRRVADDAALPDAYRNLGLIRATHLEYDKLPPAAVIDRLRGLAVPGNPWFGSAGEMVAIAHLRQNKPQLAARIFADMAKDETVPASLRSRAVQMAGSLGVDAIQEPSRTGGGANRGNGQ